MTSTQDIIERRTQKRYLVEEGAFASLRGGVTKLGQIMDISKGGLAFRYIDIGDRPNSTFEIDIYVEKNDGFHLEKVPSKSVSDSQLINNVPFSSIVMRRHGVSFEELTDNHRNQLKYFIDSHTTDECR